MKKKLSVSILFIVCTALVLFGLNAFAFGSSSSGQSTVKNGVLTKVDEQKSTISVQTAEGEKTVPYAASVWVYRNDQKAQLSDLKPGDQVELVMNSKNQAAYIKAFTAATASPAPSQAPSPTPTPTPAATPAPAVSAAPTPTKTPSPASAQSALPGMDGLRLQVNGPHFTLELKQNNGNGDKKYELNVKPADGGTVHLKGDEAAKWIRALLGPVNLNSADAEKQLLLLISQQYGIDTGKLHVKLDVQPNQRDGGHDDQDEYDRGNGVQVTVPAAPAVPAGKQVMQDDKYENKQNGNQQHSDKGKGKKEKDD